MQGIVNSQSKDYGDGVEDFMSDLMEYGCISGMVGQLCYYVDTIAWYKRHKQEIGALLGELVDDTGMSIEDLLSDWDKVDPLATDTHNQNLLAWFSFEETARRLYERQ